MQVKYHIEPDFAAHLLIPSIAGHRVLTLRALYLFALHPASYRRRADCEMADDADALADSEVEVPRCPKILEDWSTVWFPLDLAGACCITRDPDAACRVDWYSWGFKVEHHQPGQTIIAPRPLILDINCGEVVRSMNQHTLGQPKAMAALTAAFMDSLRRPPSGGLLIGLTGLPGHGKTSSATSFARLLLG
jgi:hypothetical protein